MTFSDIHAKLEEIKEAIDGNQFGYAELLTTDLYEAFIHHVAKMSDPPLVLSTKAREILGRPNKDKKF